MAREIYDRWPLALAFCWLAVALAGCNPSAEGEVSAELKKLTQRVDELEANNHVAAELKKLIAQIERLQAALPTAAAPVDAAKELQAIEAQLGDPAGRPAERQAELRKRLSKLARAADEDDEALAERLEAAAWVLNASAALADKPSEPSDERGSELERLRELKPANAGNLADAVNKLDKALVAAIAEIEKGHDAELWKQAEAARWLALANQEEVDQLTAVLDQIQLILSRATDKAQRDKAVAIKEELQRKVRLKGAEEKVRLLETSWARVKDVKEAALKQPYLSQVHGAAVGLLLDLELDGELVAGPKGRALAIVKNCEAGIQQIVQDQRLAGEQKLRNYQKMVLGELDRFNRWRNDKSLEVIRADALAFASAVRPQKWDLVNEFPEIRNFVKDVLMVEINVNPMVQVTLTVDQQRAIYDALKGTVNGLNYKATDMSFAVEREAFKRHLLPLRPDLLDPPVGELYHKTFRQSWDDLGNAGKDPEDHQLSIAKAAATVVKRPLE